MYVRRRPASARSPPSQILTPTIPSIPAMSSCKQSHCRPELVVLTLADRTDTFNHDGEHKRQRKALHGRANRDSTGSPLPVPRSRQATATASRHRGYRKNIRHMACRAKPRFFPCSGFKSSPYRRRSLNTAGTIAPTFSVLLAGTAANSGVTQKPDEGATHRRVKKWRPRPPYPNDGFQTLRTNADTTTAQTAVKIQGPKDSTHAKKRPPRRRVSRP